MRAKVVRILRWVFTRALVVVGLLVLLFTGLALYRMIPPGFIARFWWMPFSAAYTIGSMLWTWRAERMLRKLRTELRIQAHAYDILHDKVEGLEGFLENGNTLRLIPLVPLSTKKREVQ